MSNRIKRKKKLVRMLRKAVDIIYGLAARDRLGIEPDRSEVETRRILKKLEGLAVTDPNNKFGMCFTQLQLKIFRRLRVLAK